MNTKDLLKQVRYIEIKTKGVVNQLVSGEYHSVFKGRGMEFADLREYQYGDDIRNIDWNVSARTGHPFVKLYQEERELTVIIALDVSGSLEFGTAEKSKKQIATELSAVLALSATKNNDKTGLLLFSDGVEKFIPPRKGRSHSLRIIREILSFEPKNKKTNLESALHFLQNGLNKRCIIFFISDFFDSGYEKPLKSIAQKHDIIAVSINDKKETFFPLNGLIQVIDSESGSLMYIDASSAEFKRNFSKNVSNFFVKRNSIFLSAGVDYIELNTESDYLKPLIKFFKLRERRW